MSKLSKIVIVDDEIDNLNALKRLLRKDFDVHAFDNPKIALDEIQGGLRVECILSDQRMPEMAGSKFFEEIIKIDPKPTRILLTGFADIEAIIEAVNSGQIWRYVSKPWEPSDLLQTLKQGCERFQMAKHLDDSRLSLERALNHLRAKDWSRERLLQILLHEFRTLPQILIALRQFNEHDESLVDVRSKFIAQFENRLQILEEDVKALLEDEKTVSTLAAESFPLGQLLLEISIDRKVPLQDDLGQEPFGVYLPRQQLKSSLMHFIDIIAKNTAGAPVQLKLEAGRENEAYLTLSLRASEAIRPRALSNLEPALAWAALLEPFVGHEDQQHHSTGLRIDTARHVRILSSLASRPDFSVSHDGKRIDLVFSFRRAGA